MKTPADPEYVKARAGEGSPSEAVVRAWTDPGRDPAWHQRQKNMVRGGMPVLAEALNRLVAAQRTVDGEPLDSETMAEVLREIEGIAALQVMELRAAFLPNRAEPWGMILDLIEATGVTADG